MKQKETSKTVYVLKKLLTFFVIYIVANILQQLLLTGVFLIVGYDPMQGVMPSENVQTVALYYGCAVYLLLIFLYCRLAEKRSLKSIGFNKQIGDYVIGAGLAVVLLALIMGLCMMTADVSFRRIAQDADILYLIALLGGLVIQGAAEEALCRGLLLTSLMKKLSVPGAVF